MQDKKILIIDDNEQDRKAIAKVLSNAGFRQVFFAETAAKGMRAVKEHVPDIVILDVVLHTFDGLDVCLEIKKMDGVHAKVIIVTGCLAAVNAPKARCSKADEIVEKKEGFLDLLKTIERICS